MYFFQVTDYNVVIIEDLDRFETSDIFLKLRELNLLLNESKVVERKGKRPIVFIYAIKDDMFLDSERSKFLIISLLSFPPLTSLTRRIN